MRILILGAGATGGYFGGRLAEAGADVTFLVRAARAARLRETGLKIESPEGNLATPVRTITDAAEGGPYDLVMLSCKAYDLESAIEAVKPAVSPATAVLPLLNGLAHYRALDEAFGAVHVIGGLCHIMATLTAEGHVQHLAGRASITFGERKGSESARAAAIAAAFAPARFFSRPSTNLMLDAWDKLCMLATLASATCLMRAPTGVILAASGGETFIRDLYGECQAIAAASGHRLPPASLEGALGYLVNPALSATASMLRDIWAGQRVEAAHIQGDLIARAEALGVAKPLLRLAYIHLQSYEAQRPKI